jgi:hypothetical protein
MTPKSRVHPHLVAVRLAGVCDLKDVSPASRTATESGLELKSWPPYLVAARLAGGSDLEAAPAGKPCCYGSVAPPKSCQYP